MIKAFVAKTFPFLGKPKRYFVAVKDRWLTRSTYSQHQEDTYIYDMLSRYKRGIYVDVGANHPTSISNTYLLYRKGFSGVVIEPNKELLKLYSVVRKRDIAFQIGCSDTTAMMPFYVSKTPVLSTFQKERETSINTHRVYYVPIMRLDDALSNVKFDFISLLSIDVEGINYEVLRGAPKTIARSLLICIEYDEESEKKKYRDLLGDKFECIKEISCNLFFLNKELSHQLLQQ